MESRQGSRLKPKSLRLQLMLAVSAISLIAGAAASAYTFFTVRSGAQQFIDEELQQIAAVVINYDMLIPKRWEGPRHRHQRLYRAQGFGQGRGPGWRRQQMLQLQSHQQSAQTVPSLTDLSSSRFDIVIAPLFGRPGDPIFVPLGVDDGLYSVVMDKNRVRILAATKPDGQRFMVARPLAPIERIGAEALQLSVIEFAGLSLLYILLAVLAVNAVFAAVNRVAKVISERSEHDLSPLDFADKTVPQELHAFVDALNGMLARIAQSVRQKERFIADAAHEMRTPLAALSLQAENLLSLPLSPELTAKVKQLQQGIVREKELMNALLQLARLQNQTVLQPVRFKLYDLLIEILEELGPLADAKNLDFGLDVPPEMQRLEVTLPRTELKTVLYNLCSNAVKYTPEDGQVDLFARSAADGKLILGAADSGQGIAPEALTSVFEPFFRAKGDTEAVPGTGLGLAIAQAAASKLHGELKLENRSEGGLRASLSLDVLKSADTSEY